MPAIETAVEVSECEITPAAFGSDTPIPWVNIEISHEHSVVHLSFASADDVSRLMTACERSLGFFVRSLAERELSDDPADDDWYRARQRARSDKAPGSAIPACETEVIR